MLQSALKSSNSLKYAMLSGIQRVAKENIFSGLYNLKVCSVIDAFIANILALMKKKLNKY